MDVGDGFYVVFFWWMYLCGLVMWLVMVEVVVVVGLVSMVCVFLFW